MKNLQQITAKVAAISAEYGDMMGVEVNVWKGQRLYFSRPEAPRAYQNVGYVDIASGDIFPQNTPQRSFKVRTERDKSYVSFLKEISSMIEK